MTSAGSLFGSGAVASAAILLILTGADKLTAAFRPSGRACRLPLIGSRWCLPAEAGAGAAECGVGAVVCLGILPVAGGAALTALGLAFAAVTGYLLAARGQSDCGCVRWKHAERRVTGRAVARAGCVLAAGVADLWAGPPRPGYWASAWFGLGVLAGAVLLTALTVRADLRSPGCRRHLLWPARDALGALTSHPVFKEVTGADAVPPRSAFTHRRNGCADVFHLREPGHPRQGTLFEVSRSADGSVAVRAETRNRTALTGVLSSQDDQQETARFRQEDVMRAHPWAGISALASLAPLAGCAGASSTGPSAAAGTGQPSSVAATSPPASPARPSSAPAVASGAATPACVGRDLKVTVFGGAAATAAIAGEIGFTNLGGAPCHLAGYPVVTGVTASGGQVSAGHALSTEFGPNITGITAVPLAPHATAVAVVVGNDVLGVCASGTEPTFRYLLVRPPGSAVSTTVSALLPALGSYLPDCDRIGVTPVAPAASVPQQGSS